MPTPSTFRRSGLALAVLGLLENGPMHPYGIQRLLKQWGKDDVVNVGQRASLYRIIDRLEAAGLIASGETRRDERYPERTTYRLTDSGRAASRRWLAEMIATPRNEFPEFPAALSFVMLLPPDVVRELLEQRQELLAERVHAVEAVLSTAPDDAGISQVVLIETEYQRAVAQAELRWVTETLQILRDGSLSWEAPPATEDTPAS
ncbi:MAG TPA: PadR family transcriptional regulator [Cellulomonadaceae bacterium]|nr:PadR family transcriptional regulator [Cellulomonadaceae bacterium]